MLKVYNFRIKSGIGKWSIHTCCYFAMHAVLRGKSKNWLARNQDNVSEWGDMAIRGVLCQ